MLKTLIINYIQYVHNFAFNRVTQCKSDMIEYVQAKKLIIKSCTKQNNCHSEVNECETYICSKIMLSYFTVCVEKNNYVSDKYFKFNR